MTHFLMRAPRLGAMCTLLASLVMAGCGDPGAVDQEPIETGRALQAISAAVQQCNLDPRVWSGLVPLNVCAGARVFFDEDFDGNGRTCATCHRAENSMTIDPAFVQTLPNSDPLFVAENESDPFDLAGLETSALRPFAAIKENVDGFEDNDNKFAIRGVPHVLSMSTSLVPDPADGTDSASFVERTGWSGDGVTGGALRDFLNGAIIQHYPTDLGREEGTAFRLATSEELDQVLAFQLALGRSNELDLETVVLNDPFAEQGRLDFLDPQIGRCNECHSNAGANALESGKNRNFNTGSNIVTPSAFELPIFAGVELEDGGFGGQNLPAPNFPAEAPNSFGDGTFNTPPLIEAADTGPFFHNNGLGPGTNTQLTGLPGVVAFYQTDLFNDSPAGQELAAKFGGPIPTNGLVVVEITQFLRVLNGAFNMALAIQRLGAAELLNFQYWNYREDLQQGLLNLAREELDDALRVIQAQEGPPMYPNAIATMQQARADIDAALGASDPAIRLQKTKDSRAKISAAKDALGTNLNFELGSGNLMF